MKGCLKRDQPCGFGWMSQNGDLLGKKLAQHLTVAALKKQLLASEFEESTLFKKKIFPPSFQGVRRFFVSRLFEWRCVIYCHWESQC